MPEIRNWNWNLDTLRLPMRFNECQHSKSSEYCQFIKGEMKKPNATFSLNYLEH